MHGPVTWGSSVRSALICPSGCDEALYKNKLLLLLQMATQLKTGHSIISSSRVLFTTLKTVGLAICIFLPYNYLSEG